MPVERIDMHRLQDLVRLHRLGVGPRTIARRLRMSPNTERQYRRALAVRGLLAGDPTALPELITLLDAIAAALPPKTPPQQVSSLAPVVESAEEKPEDETVPEPGSPA